MQIGSFDEGPLPLTAAGEVGAPGVPQPVTEGVWRIPLPVSFPPGTVNAYVLHGEGQWVLVDCGMGTRSSDAALAKGLAALGISTADLGALVLTHAHPDHIGPAGDLVAQMPPTAPVLMLGREAERMFSFWGEQNFAILQAAQVMSGLSAEQAQLGAAAMQRLATFLRLPMRERVAGLRDGEMVTLGGRAWQAIWTPGHAEGHMCLASDPLVIVGDHILPTISPNVGFFTQSRPDPIGDYLWGLDRIGDLAIVEPLALPGHGAHFPTLGARIDALRTSTARRSAHALAALHDGPATGLTVTERLFADRLRDPADVWLALGETVAHLEHLRATNQAQREERDGQAWYHLVGA